jgi:hypothetical protein
MAPWFGAVAIAVSETVPPTVVSEGLAETPVATAQSKVVPPIDADPASGTSELHWSSTVTLVVVRLVTENVAEPAQVTVPSTEVPAIATA